MRDCGQSQFCSLILRVVFHASHLSSIMSRMNNMMILGSFFFVAGPAQPHFGRARLWHLGGQFLILQSSLALLSSLTSWPTCPLIIITRHEYQQVLSSSPHCVLHHHLPEVRITGSRNFFFGLLSPPSCLFQFSFFFSIPLHKEISELYERKKKND